MGVLAASKKEHWLEAGQWLFYTIVIGALPFWGVALILWIFAQPVSPAIFTKDAELAVYSAGLLASAIPVLQREIKDSPFRFPRLFIAVAILVIVVAGLVFASVTLSTHVNEAANTPIPLLAVRGARLLVVSIVLALGSVVLCFFTELFNNVRQDVNYRGMREQDVANLTTKVNRLLDKQSDG